MRVYAEGVFLLGFGMNTLLLWLVGRIRCRPARLRLFLSAALGGLWGVAALPCPILAGPAARVIGSLVMVLAAYPSRSVRETLTLWAGFWGLTLLAGGVLQAEGASLWTTVLAAAGTALLGGLSIPWGRAVRRYAGLRWGRHPCRALADTGNLLREPFTGLPVLVVDPSWARRTGFTVKEGVTLPCGTAGCTRLMRVETMESWTMEGIPLEGWVGIAENRLAADALLPPEMWKEKGDGENHHLAAAAAVQADGKRCLLCRRKRLSAAASHPAAGGEDAGGDGSGEPGCPGSTGGA